MVWPLEIAFATITEVPTTGTSHVRANKLKPMASSISYSSHRPLTSFQEILEHKLSITCYMPHGFSHTEERFRIITSVRWTEGDKQIRPRSRTRTSPSCPSAFLCQLLLSAVRKVTYTVLSLRMKTELDFTADNFMSRAWYTASRHCVCADSRMGSLPVRQCRYGGILPVAFCQGFLTFNKT